MSRPLAIVGLAAGLSTFLVEVDQCRSSARAPAVSGVAGPELLMEESPDGIVMEEPPVDSPAREPVLAFADLGIQAGRQGARAPSQTELQRVVPEEVVETVLRHVQSITYKSVIELMVSRSGPGVSIMNRMSC